MYFSNLFLLKKLSQNIVKYLMIFNFKKFLNYTMKI